MYCSSVVYVGEQSDPDVVDVSFAEYQYLCSDAIDENLRSLSKVCLLKDRFALYREAGGF